MDIEQTRQWLNAIWSETLEKGTNEPDAEIDRLVNSEVLSIRYAVLTQFLGKISDGMH